MVHTYDKNYEDNIQMTDNWEIVLYGGYWRVLNSGVKSLDLLFENINQPVARRIDIIKGDS